MRFSARWVVAVCLLLASGSARADDAAQAKQLYERGMAHFQLGEYDDAIGRWQEGFRLKPVPEFLYNIGQAYRLSNRPEKALLAYKAYLRMTPEANNHAQVEKHIVSLQALVDQQHRTATAPPVSPRDPGIESSSSPAAAAAPATEPVASAPAATAGGAASSGSDNQLTVRERKTPITKKPWLWGVVAGGAVVVAGVVVLGVVLGTKDNTKVLGDLRY